jgi:hypothetical protein
VISPTIKTPPFKIQIQVVIPSSGVSMSMGTTQEENVIVEKLRRCVVLDRVRPDWTPPYCVHGKATCFGCGRWVYLGSETYRPVAAREIEPLCMECAMKAYPAGTQPIGNLKDHRRADGPHD